MSIRINTDLEYLISRLNIPPIRAQEYKDKTVDEILQAEAAAGNQLAIKMAADMFTDVSRLIEIFRLADPNNKLVILRAMSSQQMRELIPMLEVNDLVEGLNFFTQDALLEMIEELPMEELLKSVFQMFSQKEVIDFMPEEQLDKLLTDIHTDKELVLKSLHYIPDMYLQQILESVTGEEAKGSTSDLILQIGQLGDLNYKNALVNLEPTQKQHLSFIICNQDNKLFQTFDASAYTEIMDKKRYKEDIVKSMTVVKPEYLHKMMDKLPDDLLSIVLTQIDTQKFADMLINKHPELLAQFVAAG